MTLSGSGDDRQLVGWGQLPIQMRRIVADLDLRTAAGHAARLSVLSLRGTTLTTRPVALGKDGAASIRLDSAAVAGSPTTFFLLEAN